MPLAAFPGAAGTGAAGAAAVAGAVGATDALAVALQSESLLARLPTAAAQVLGLSLVAGGLAAVVALGYRWYVNERVPSGLPILVGLSGVALYLGSSRALTELIGNTGDPLDAMTALANIVTFLVALAAARGGMDVGDRVGVDVFVATGATEVTSEVSRVVQAVGRVITVEVPEEVDDIVGYDPVPDETKAKLAGKTFVFPRRLTVAELRDRLVTRLKADYAVGHVDIDLTADGTVEYLALGSRAAGIGPTLPPETSAVAVRADPAFAASAGDLVQVWRTDPHERVLTAEVRAAVDDVVTLAVDAADTRKLDAGERYKLVTLPVETRPDREFVSLLRAADETMAAVTVGGGSALDGQPTGALDVSVVAVRPAEGPVEPLPGRDRPLRAGDSLYLVATPEAIRKAEAAATAPTERPATPAGGARLAPEERVDAGRAVGTAAASDSAASTDGPPEESASAPSQTAGSAAATGEGADAATVEATGSGTNASDGAAASDDADALDGADATDDTVALDGADVTDDTDATDEPNTGADADDAAATLGDPDLVDLDGTPTPDDRSDSSNGGEADETTDGDQWTTVGEGDEGGAADAADASDETSVDGEEAAASGDGDADGEGGDGDADGECGDGDADGEGGDGDETVGDGRRDGGA